MTKLPFLQFTHLKNWVKTYAIAALGGWIAMKIGLPIPWMLGPLVVIAILSMLEVPLTAPPFGRPIGQWLLGVAIGLSFTPFAVVELVHDIPYIAIACLLSMVLLAFGTWMLSRYFQIPLYTAYFASALGGAAEMTLLADRHQQRADLVAAAHSVRLLLVLLIIPMLFQIWVDPGVMGATVQKMPVNPMGVLSLILLAGLGIAGFHVLKLPNAFLLGPLFIAGGVTAFGFEWTAWPQNLSLLAQLLLGVSLGLRFNQQFMVHAKKLVVGITLYTFITCLVSAIFALSITKVSGLDFQSLLLSMAPGGMAEMSITAKVFQLNVPAVTVFHVVRMVFVIMTTELIFKLIVKRVTRKLDLD